MTGGRRKLGPGLSVVMPTYNGDRYIDRTLRSITAQIDLPLEIIVVDDGSSDTTLDIVQSYEAKLPIRLIRPTRQGNWLAMTNIGLAEASGEWCTVLHQDDLWSAQRNQRLFNRLRNIRDFEPSLMVMRTRFIDSSGRDIGPWNFPSSLLRNPQPVDISWSLYIQNWIAVPSAVFATARARDVGGMDETLWYTADWDLWLKLARDTNVMLVDESGSFFRVHDDSQTMSGSRDLSSFRRQLVTVQKRHVWAIHRHPEPQRVSRAARLAIETNIALAGALHCADHSFLPLIGAVKEAGLTGTITYLDHSTITSRLMARFRATASGRLNSSRQPA